MVKTQRCLGDRLGQKSAYWKRDATCSILNCFHAIYSFPNTAVVADVFVLGAVVAGLLAKDSAPLSFSFTTVQRDKLKL